MSEEELQQQPAIDPAAADRIRAQALRLLEHWPKPKREFGQYMVDMLDRAIEEGDAQSFRATAGMIQGHTTKYKRKLASPILGILAEVFRLKTGIDLGFNQPAAAPAQPENEPEA